MRERCTAADYFRVLVIVRGDRHSSSTIIYNYPANYTSQARFANYEHDRYWYIADQKFGDLSLSVYGGNERWKLVGHPHRDSHVRS